LTRRKSTSATCGRRWSTSARGLSDSIFSALTAATVDVRVRPSASSAGGTTGFDRIAGCGQHRAIAGWRVRTTRRRGPNPTLIGARAIDGAVALGPEGIASIARSSSSAASIRRCFATAKGTLGGARPFRAAGRRHVAVELPGQTARGNAGSDRFARALRGGWATEQRRRQRAGSRSRSGRFQCLRCRRFHADCAASIHGYGRPQPCKPTCVCKRIETHRRSTVRPGGKRAGRQRDAGPLDAGQIPARSAAGIANWSADTLAIDNVVAELVRGSARAGSA